MADDRKAVLLRLEPELLERVDAACQGLPRQRWIHRAVEAALWESEETRAAHADLFPSSLATLPDEGQESPGSEARKPNAGEESPEQLAASPIVPPTKDGECPYTAAQLSGMTGLPVGTCKRKIEDGTWRALV